MTTIRCSELDRVLACPGSLSLVPRVAPRESDDGEEGTALQWIAHTEIKRTLGAHGELGPTPPMPKNLAQAKWIGDYYVRTVRDTVPAGWSLECEVAMAYEYEFERPVYGYVEEWHDDDEGERVRTFVWRQISGFTLSGHIDCVAVNSDATEAIGFDLKTGYNPVDPADSNEQMLGYSVLLLKAYPTLRRITFCIVQPRNDEDEGFERVSKAEMKEDLVSLAESSLVSRVLTAMENCMETDSGMKQCKWCPAATQCPSAIAEREIMKAQLKPEYLEAIRAKPDDATLIQWVRASKTLSRPMEDAENLLKDRIKENGHATGDDGTLVTIKEEGGAYSFPDPVAFYRATRHILADDEVYAATVKPSTTKTKDAIAKVRGIPKKSMRGESAESVFERELGHLCEQGKREKLVWRTP